MTQQFSSLINQQHYAEIIKLRLMLLFSTHYAVLNSIERQSRPTYALQETTT